MASRCNILQSPPEGKLSLSRQINSKFPSFCFTFLYPGSWLMGFMGLFYVETKKVKWDNHSRRARVSLSLRPEDLVLTHLSWCSVASFSWTWWVHGVTLLWGRWGPQGMSFSIVAPGSGSGFSLPTQGCKTGTCGRAHTWTRAWRLGSSDE